MIRRGAVWLLLVAAACRTPSPLPPSPPPPISPPPEVPAQAKQALTPTPAPSAVYVVQKNDTLYSIARRHGQSVTALVAANPGLQPTKIAVGQKLTIPAPKGAVAAAPKSSAPSAAKPSAPPAAKPVATRVAPAPKSPPPPVKSAPAKVQTPLDPPEVRAALARMAHAPAVLSETSPEVGKAPFIWPVDGVVISGFGRREGTKHEGIDIAAPEGTPVWSSAAGLVLFAGEQPGYGRLVVVAHAGELVTIYGHNQVNLVREGARVVQGQAIARVGQTGGGTSPALHFEVRAANKPIDPIPRLPP